MAAAQPPASLAPQSAGQASLGENFSGLGADVCPGPRLGAPARLAAELRGAPQSTRPRSVRSFPGEGSGVCARGAAAGGAAVIPITWLSPARMWRLLSETASEWMRDHSSRRGAALAYYTIFSLAPILILAIAIAGMFFGEEAARGEIVAQIGGLVGAEGARAIQAMIQNASQPGTGLAAAIIGML